jgi:DNA-directed RNA polymerase subunit L
MANTDTEQKFSFDIKDENDKIDIYAKPELKVKSFSEDGLYNVELEGHSIDSSVANALRRTIARDIPIYGFHRSNIKIDISKTKTMYNNDMIYGQIEMLPIFNIPNFFDLEKPHIYMSNNVMKELFSTFVADEFVVENDEEVAEDTSNKKMFEIEISIDVKNNTSDFKWVNSHDAILTVGGKTSDEYRKHKHICLFVLKPNEEISLYAKANLGISGAMGAIYESTTNPVHEEINPSKYRIMYETLGQLESKIIFEKACKIIVMKLKLIDKFIKSNDTFVSKNNETEIQLHGETTTLGYLLATILQKCSLVKSAGYRIAHPLIEQVEIKYICNDNIKKSPIEVLSDSIKYAIKLFEMIMEQNK